jgi:hypothetical protein
MIMSFFITVKRKVTVIPVTISNSELLEFLSILSTSEATF